MLREFGGIVSCSLTCGTPACTASAPSCVLGTSSQSQAHQPPTTPNRYRPFPLKALPTAVAPPALLQIPASSPPAESPSRPDPNKAICIWHTAGDSCSAKCVRRHRIGSLLPESVPQEDGTLKVYTNQPLSLRLIAEQLSPRLPLAARHLSAAPHRSHTTPLPLLGFPPKLLLFAPFHPQSPLLRLCGVACG